MSTHNVKSATSMPTPSLGGLCAYTAQDLTLSHIFEHPGWIAHALEYSQFIFRRQSHYMPPRKIRNTRDTSLPVAFKEMQHGV